MSWLLCYVEMRYVSRLCLKERLDRTGSGISCMFAVLWTRTFTVLLEEGRFSSDWKVTRLVFLNKPNKLDLPFSYYINQFAHSMNRASCLRGWFHGWLHRYLDNIGGIFNRTVRVPYQSFDWCGVWENGWMTACRMGVWWWRCLWTSPTPSTSSHDWPFILLYRIKECLTISDESSWIIYSINTWYIFPWWYVC